MVLIVTVATIMKGLVILTRNTAVISIKSIPEATTKTIKMTEVKIATEQNIVFQHTMISNMKALDSIPLLVPTCAVT